MAKKKLGYGKNVKNKEHCSKIGNQQPSATVYKKTQCMQFRDQMAVGRLSNRLKIWSDLLKNQKDPFEGRNPARATTLKKLSRKVIVLIKME